MYRTVDILESDLTWFYYYMGGEIVSGGYEPVPDVRHKNGTVQAENEYGRLIKLSIFLSVA